MKGIREKGKFSLDGQTAGKMHFAGYDIEAIHKTASYAEMLELAVHFGEKHTFQHYFLPKGTTSFPEASDVNHLTVDCHSSGRKELRYKGEPVETVPIRQGLTDFIDFLSGIVKSSGPSDYLALIAHNGSRYDEQILSNYLIKEDLDTNPTFKQILLGNSLSHW